MNYSLIAVDMDGTLLNSDSQVSKENFEAIRRLNKKGILTVPVTGRTYYEIPENVRNCRDIKYIVYSNGSVIYDNQHGRILASSTLSAEKGKAVFSLLDSYETYIEIYSGGRPWVDKNKFGVEYFNYYNIKPKFQAVILENRSTEYCFHSRIGSDDFKIELLDAFFRSMQERDECFKRLTELFPDEEVTTSMGNNIEIMNSGANKGAALARLCALTGVDISETLAMGDSKNDLKLFEAAGAACAVTNACEEIKAAADYHICSNNAHVIAYAEEYIL